MPTNVAPQLFNLLPPVTLATVESTYCKTGTINFQKKLKRHFNTIDSEAPTYIQSNIDEKCMLKKITNEAKDTYVLSYFWYFQ